MKKVLIYLILFLSFNIYGQSITWQRMYESGLDRYGNAGIETMDWGYAILSNWGPFSTFPGTANFIKTDAYGSIQFEKSYRVGTTEDFVQAPDSGYFLAGSWFGSAAVMKISNLGDSLWQRGYGSDTRFLVIKMYVNGTYVLAGEKDYGSSFVAYICMIDSLGNLIWERIISDPNYAGLACYDLLSDPNGDLAIVGNACRPGSSCDVFLFKLSSDGTLYSKKIISNYPLVIRANNILKSYDNGYVISGYGPVYSYCSHLTFTDTAGNVIKQSFYDDCMPLLTKTKDSMYAMSGRISLGMYEYSFGVRKVNKNGNQLWLRQLPGSPSISSARDFSLTSDGGFLLTGWYYDTLTDYAALYVAKTDSAGQAYFIGISNNQNESPGQMILSPAYPNPFNSSTSVRISISKSDDYELSLYNFLGQRVNTVFNKFIPTGNYTFKLNDVFAHLPSSVYFLVLSSKELSLSQKLVYLK